MFKKILISNRGEIALRIIKTCKKMNIKTVSIYSLVDKDSLHVKNSNKSFLIKNCLNKLPYLNIKNIIYVALTINAEGIHPGYGFLSENEKFSEMCKKYNIKFIGPNYKIIKKIGNKLNAKKIINKINIKIVAGSKKKIKNIKNGINISKKIKFPIILKASNGGGGKGIKIIKYKKELKKYWKNIKIESKKFFNNEDIYLEKYIKNHKHLEIQVIKKKKYIYYLLERDCSIQKKNQKIIEETPSLFINNKIRNKIINTTIKYINYINYQGIGTIEYILDKNNIFYFIEINPRIQVEHAITEEISKIDIIKLQIMITHDKIIKIKKFFYSKLHSIEYRINAENIKKKLYPSTGIIKKIYIPNKKKIRIETSIYEGYKVTHYYDSMIIKIIISSYSRINSIHKTKIILKKFIIEGVNTTIKLHKKIINDKNFIKGYINTQFIKNFF